MSEQVRTLSVEQGFRLLAARHAVSEGAPPATLLGHLATHLASVLDAQVFFAALRDGAWSIVAPPDATDEVIDGNQASFARAVSHLGAGVGRWDVQGRMWTVVPLAPVPHARLLIEGDWSSAEQVLADIAEALCSTDAPTVASPEFGLAAYELARELGPMEGLRELCERVVRHVVRTLPCRVATLAVPTDQGNLSIVATHGYPVALTEHLRILPGAGVIGAVYQNGVPLRVADVSTVPGLERKRSRYRTKSFAALPIAAGSDVLAVLCVTDRAGDGPFTVEDVSNLGMLMAPVALALSRERTQRQAQFYARAAILDPASGLFNRLYFQNRLQEELQRATRQNTPLSLLMTDIDSFKSINDTFGHLAGDTVIKDVAEILKSSVRVFDVCARYGGEEFAVVMPGSSLESATVIADRIRQRIQGYHTSDHALAGLRVTVSIGVAEAGALGSVRDLVERADTALYTAKRAGRNRVSTSPAPRG